MQGLVYALRNQPFSFAFPFSLVGILLVIILKVPLRRIPVQNIVLEDEDDVKDDAYIAKTKFDWISGNTTPVTL
jgi:hypothetical protein